ncbi:MAG: hypothetical protein KGI67_01695 [Pseudomonadota bacterium]|nr:hypothetical protein [Pseudomonadota bacterium]
MVRVDELEAALPDPARRDIPEEVDGFSVEALLGDTGIGTVYLARQRRPERRVVLRVLPGIPAAPSDRARAERELGVLLELNEACLPRLFASGNWQSPAGELPYLVMECIDGRPLLESCACAGLDLRARMQLLATIARTVHALHCRGVVHGGLASHNIIITAGKEPRILDAGSGAWRAKPAAAAVPQAEPEAERHDPAPATGGPEADIRALGRIGTELVALAEPVPAASRAANRVVPDDLFAILRQATGARNAAAYGSALEFALDIECWLESRPVTARPGSALHRARLFASRHRAATVGGVAAMLALAGMLAASVHLAGGQRAALARAETRSRELAAANHFLGTTLLANERAHAGGHPGSLRSVLDQARAQLLESQDMSDAVDVRVRALLGETYAGLGDVATGLPMQEEAVARAEGSQEVDAVLRKQATIGLARTLAGNGQAARAVNLLKPMLGDEPGSDSEGRMNWARLRTVLIEASLTLGDTDAAERYSRDLDGFAEQWFGATAEPTLNVRATRVMIDYQHAHYRDVLHNAQKLSDDIARWQGPQHPVRASMLALAGLGAREMDNLPLARRLFLEAARVSEALYGPEATRTLDNRRRVAEIDHGQRPADRGPVNELRAVMEAEQRRFGPQGTDTLAATVAFASAALDLADAASQAEGERLLQELVDGMNGGTMPRNLSTIKAEFALAHHMEATGRPDRALQMYREVRATASQSLGPQHQLVFRSGTATAQLLEHLRLAGEARKEYAELLPQLRQAYGEKDPRTRQVAQRLAALASAGDPR